MDYCTPRFSLSHQSHLQHTKDELCIFFFLVSRLYCAVTGMSYNCISFYTYVSHTNRSGFSFFYVSQSAWFSRLLPFTHTCTLPLSRTLTAHLCVYTVPMAIKLQITALVGHHCVAFKEIAVFTYLHPPTHTHKEILYIPCSYRPICQTKVRGGEKRCFVYSG